MPTKIQKQHWLKSVQCSPKPMITQKGLRTTQVYIDSSAVSDLHRKYQNLRRLECLNIEKFLIDIMSWEHSDLIPSRSLPPEIYLHLPLPYKVEASGECWSAHGVKNPDTDEWIMAVNAINRIVDIDKPFTTDSNRQTQFTNFCRYLINARIPLGILYTPQNLRLVCVLTKSTTWIDFDMNQMAESIGEGSEILAGLESLLNAQRMFNLSLDRRLINIVKNSQPQD